MNCYTHNEKKYGLIVFGVPAFVPSILHLLFLFDFDASGMNNLFYENIEIFKRAFETKRSNEVLVWGYLFSIFYLLFILPFMIVRSKRIVFLGGEIKNKTKAIWLLLATLLFSIFLFLNFVDYSSGSRKYAEVIELSFYFWPLFYFYFLFPLYVSLMLMLAFVNTEIK
jgi:hypothetical protein|tara:strand:- start:1416 stop:1919 length:504 start_codon:yes stop_codon:yes gene_type:complete